MPKKTPFSEDIISNALAAYHASENPKIAAIAREFKIPYPTLCGRVRGSTSRNIASSPKRALNFIQEKALIHWITTLHRIYINPYPDLIEKNANRLLKHSGEDRVVGHNQVYRFIERLPPPQTHYVTQKPKEKKRMESENIDLISIWFDHYTDLIKKHRFIVHEVFNWDETGFVIGQGKPRKVISATPFVESPTGDLAEGTTGIECISASGWSMMPQFLVKGSRHQEEWYSSIDIDDFRIRPTANGWIKDYVTLEQLISFNKALVKADRGFY